MQIMEELKKQFGGGVKKYGGITDLAELKTNFSENCIPQHFLDGVDLDYDQFLEQRQKLMALRIKKWNATP